MAGKRRSRSSGLQALIDRYVGDDPERVASFERARDDANVAMSVHELRTQAGLSQRELAARVGTTASVISRLEDADYEGHSMAMLRRVAAALGQRVEVRFPVLKAAKAVARIPATKAPRPGKPTEAKAKAKVGPAARKAARTSNHRGSSNKREVGGGSDAI